MAASTLASGLREHGCRGPGARREGCGMFCSVCLPVLCLAVLRARFAARPHAVLSVPDRRPVQAEQGVRGSFPQRVQEIN